jgi:hypothetical protein
MKRILVHAKRVKQLLIGFYILLGLLLISDLIVHKHATFFWENLPFFFPLFSFVSCIIIFLAARFLGVLLKREEDYYD